MSKETVKGVEIERRAPTADELYGRIMDMVCDAVRDGAGLHAIMGVLHNAAASMDEQWRIRVRSETARETAKRDAKKAAKDAKDAKDGKEGKA